MSELATERRRSEDDGAPVRTRRSDADPTTTEVLLRQTWEAMREASAATTRAAAAQEALTAELRSATAEGSLQRQEMARVVALGQGHLARVQTAEEAERLGREKAMGRLEAGANALWGVARGPLGYVLAAAAIYLGAQYLGAPATPPASASARSVTAP
jgi:hypothetical protein